VSRPRLAVVVVAAVAALGASVLAGSPLPVAADAGPDLALSAARGPVGTTLELHSPDVFGMGVDVCPGLDTDQAWDEADTFEVRWELGLVSPAVLDSSVAQGPDFRIATTDVAVVEVLDTGVVATEVDVPWRTTVTVPEGLVPGQRLVVKGACWHLGADGADGAEVWFTYYYVPLFTVTAADGSVPVTTPSPSVPTAVTVAPVPVTPAAPPAAPRPGAAAFTG
jgi:hypothetical protein